MRMCSRRRVWHGIPAASAPVSGSRQTMPCRNSANNGGNKQHQSVWCAKCKLPFPCDSCKGIPQPIGMANRRRDTIECRSRRQRALLQQTRWHINCGAHCIVCNADKRTQHAIFVSALSVDWRASDVLWCAQQHAFCTHSAMAAACHSTAGGSRNVQCARKIEHD